MTFQILVQMSSICASFIKISKLYPKQKKKKVSLMRRLKTFDFFPVFQ